MSSLPPMIQWLQKVGKKKTKADSFPLKEVLQRQESTDEKGVILCYILL